MTYEPNIWYGWNGGECPVDPDLVVNYIVAWEGPARRESSFGKWKAGELTWGPDRNNCGCIVAFKISTEENNGNEK